MFELICQIAETNLPTFTNFTELLLLTLLTLLNKVGSLC